MPSPYYPSMSPAGRVIFFFLSTRPPLKNRAVAEGSGTGSGSHGQLFRPFWGSSAWHSRWVNEREKVPCIKDPDDELMSPDDMAVCMREVLARLWIGVCLPFALSLSS